MVITCEPHACSLPSDSIKVESASHCAVMLMQTQMSDGFARVSAQVAKGSGEGEGARSCFATFQQHAFNHGWLEVA